MELNEKRQIYIDEAVEEMASNIREITVKCGKCEYYKDGSCLKPIDIGCDINEDILNECDALYNANYRKIYDDHARQCTCYALGCQMAEQLEHEVAYKIFAEIKEVVHRHRIGDLRVEYIYNKLQEIENKYLGAANTIARNCNISFGEMLTKFKQKYPIYAKEIIDYRPSKFMNGITVWFYGGESLSVTYNSNEDRFELLDLDNYTFYERVE